MGLKGLATFALLSTTMLAPAAVCAETGNSSVAKQPILVAWNDPSANSLPSTTSGGESSFQTPRITVANPPPTQVPWTWQQEITWAANLILVILGYIGIMMAIQLLRKIDRQAGYAEASAETAAASAQAALLNAQAVIHSERPWLLITVEPSKSIENSFTVLATNRGRTPAKIVATAERTRIVIDENHLPPMPEYKNERPGAPVVPIILVPGESAVIKPFCRDDVKGLCDSEERFKRIETWDEKVFLYGKVIYKDLIAPADDQGHETNWCCWYIHGRQNSGLVIAGPPEYNSHS
ncbi:MAG: hypothetical protein ABR907_03570 [Terracidiphilus sp.]|jgi:hypothetical protein